MAPKRARLPGDDPPQWLELDLIIKPRPVRGQPGGRAMFRGSGYFGSQEMDASPTMQSGGGSGAGSGMASGASAGATEDIWVVLDVQSFLEGPAEGETGPPRNVVRINVARRRNLEQLDHREQRELSPDGALEIVGYIPILASSAKNDGKVEDNLNTIEN